MMNPLKFKDVGTDQLMAVAEKVLASGKRKFALYGEMGAGKTTLIQALCKQLGIPQNVTSPTFTLLNEYSGSNKVYHFDFYRLKNEEEILTLGFIEIFFSNDYVFIEWPEKAASYVPDSFAKIEITIQDKNKRDITCK